MMSNFYSSFQYLTTKIFNHSCEDGDDLGGVNVSQMYYGFLLLKTPVSYGSSGI